MINSVAGQRQAILKRLQEHGALTTNQARDELGIMSPAARILELRKQGKKIITYWTTSKDRAGTMHREAKYVLFNQDNKKAPTTSDQTNEQGYILCKDDITHVVIVRQAQMYARLESTVKEI